MKLLITFLSLIPLLLYGQTITYPVGVHWLNDPDAAFDGNIYAQTLSGGCVRLVGGDSDPTHTILAVNRGHTQGAMGNYTMFHVTADTLIAENITFGNYCNVDLHYLPDPIQDRKRRASAVVQSQIGVCDGTKLVHARGCRFISRLNMCNFVGAEKAIFENCYIECGDDALAGNAVYRHCQLVFFSSKPFYSTDKGAIFDDCDIYIKRESQPSSHLTQYFTKVPSPVTLNNVRIHSDYKVNLAWAKDNDPDICHAVGVTLNGKKARIDEKKRRTVIERQIISNGKELINGAQWTFESFKPSDTKQYDWMTDASVPAWYYGTAVDGAEGYRGYVQNVRGARIVIDGERGVRGKKKKIRVTLCPCKSAGQGFGSATGQYLDLCLAMDTVTMSGYGLRFERTPDYDHAVAVSLIEYRNECITHITLPEKCELYKSPCRATVELVHGLLSATITHNRQKQTIKYPVGMQAADNAYGEAYIIQHTGSVGSNATLIADCKVY